jgi:hypothetical protein
MYLNYLVLSCVHSTRWFLSFVIFAIAIFFGATAIYVFFFIRNLLWF